MDDWKIKLKPPSYPSNFATIMLLQSLILSLLLHLTNAMNAKSVMHEMFDSPPSPIQSTSPIPVKFGPNQLRGSSNPSHHPHILSTVRFAESKITTTAIGPCSCDFLSGVTATKPVGSTANCAPKSALCLFCMGAAYNDYWSPKVDSCEPYVSKAKDVCKAVAGAVKGSASAKLKVMYQAFGPQFGASAVFCREGGCCAGKPAL